MLLHHGTTLRRAQAILTDGPNPRYREPHQLGDEPSGFSMAPAAGPYPLCSPEEYAERKDLLFPDEGGPAIIEVVVPDNIVELAVPLGGEFRFDEEGGIPELLAAWPSLTKRILSP